MNRLVPAVLSLLLPGTLAAQGTLSATVFDDRNGNGARDSGERPIPGVVISNQRDVATTDASGIARLERGPTGIVFVSVPNGYRSVGAFWRASAPADSQLTFALQPAPAPRTFTFVHASDTHIAPPNVDRTRRLRQLVDSIRPDFTIVTGDLIFDAMSQQEPRARSFFELFEAETRGFASRCGRRREITTISASSRVARTCRRRIRSMTAGCIDSTGVRTTTRSRTVACISLRSTR
jgi:hypothetical protein